MNSDLGARFEHLKFLLSCFLLLEGMVLICMAHVVLFPGLRVKRLVDAFVCEGEACECLSMCANTSCSYTCEIGMMSGVKSQKVRVCASL